MPQQEVRHWRCPYCNHYATLQQDDYVSKGVELVRGEPAEGHKYLEWYYVVCPNPECKRYTLDVTVYDYIAYEYLGYKAPRGKIGDLVREVRIVPQSFAKAYPDYIPKPILDDYNEACLIADLSPKASATLSRRCLQGIIRDFWGVKAGSLADEIKQIKDKVDPQTWEAIDAVRKIGNIGAHMERNVNEIVDIEPKEAFSLIELIEILLEEWYIARKVREDRLAEIKAIADEKENSRKKEGPQSSD